jgi:hypothetical protein
VGPSAVLDAVVKRKIPIPRWELNTRTPIVQPVLMIITVIISKRDRHPHMNMNIQHRHRL